ncbi:hypothetical protein CK203_092022 [Vitis vinifera]|uniref:Uncharacterized protein n=1 Tax=Vitis vinifera TaxID=29760 RepID=A0A438CWB3_VITVI|nr:hypothetical protein CK203_092022 [Vitis vinifera]
MVQRAIREKNVLAERLKVAEAMINKFDEELKRYASEAVNREEVQKLLQNEVQWFKQKVEQTELEKMQKEEHIASYEAYITSMEAKLNECQVFISPISFGNIFFGMISMVMKVIKLEVFLVMEISTGLKLNSSKFECQEVKYRIIQMTYISSLEVALRDEMLQHAPLYGVGLEDMSVEELDTLSSIHEEGLRAIHSLQQQKGIPRGNPLMSLSTTAALPPPLVSDGVHHRNGHVNGTDRPPLNYS